MSNVPEEFNDLWSAYVESVKDADDFEQENSRFLSVHNQLKDRKKALRSQIVEMATDLHEQGLIDDKVFDDMVGVYFKRELKITVETFFIEMLVNNTTVLDLTLGEMLRPNLTNVKAKFIDAVVHRRIPSEIIPGDVAEYSGHGFKVVEERKVSIARELK
jgi:hypothetical protein